MAYRISGYYIIWIEGLNYKTGDKIKNIGSSFEQIGNKERLVISYTTYMTEALRVKGSQIHEVEALLGKCGIEEQFIDFVPVNYAPSGTVLKENYLKSLPKVW